MIVSTKRIMDTIVMSVSDQGAVSAANGRRRRRLWSDEEKRRIVAEAAQPGASVSVVARRHDVNANMVFTWRRQLGAAMSGSPDDTSTFVPAVIGAARLIDVRRRSARQTMGAKNRRHENAPYINRGPRRRVTAQMKQGLY